MLVLESRRTRSLILQLDSGAPLPAALQQALDLAEAKAAWVTGFGALESAEIVIADPQRQGAAVTRRIDGPCELLSLTGNVALQDGAGSLRLVATLARETELGPQVFGGQLVSARCSSVELHVVVFDDVGLTRAIDERSKAPVLQSSSSASSASSAPADTPRSPAPGSAPNPMVATAREPGAQASPPVPVRSKPREEPEAYPEPGDLVNHFHFGECTIIESDGDRIRLRQDKDGRVRDVSLTMLRIQAPTVDPASGKRHFQLARKN